MILVLVGALRLSLTQLVVVSVPVMFYVSLSAVINVAASDVLIPAILIGLATGAVPRPPPWVNIYAASLSLVLIVVLTIAAWSAPTFRWGDAALAVVKILICLVYLLAFAGVTREDVMRRLLVAWSATAIAIAALSLLSVLGALSFGRQYGGVRNSGTFEDPNLYATYLLVSISVVAATPRLWLPMRALGLVALVLATLTTGSRAAAVALIAMALGYLVLAPVSGKLRLAGLAAAGGAFLLLGRSLVAPALPSLERVSGTAVSTETDIRFTLWRSALQVWSDHPLVGVGPGQFRGQQDLLAHNTFLSFLAETGVIGTVVLLSLPVALGVLLFRGRKLRKEVDPMIVGLIGVTISMASLNLQNARFVWMFFGVCAALVVMCRRAQQASTRQPVTETVGPRGVIGQRGAGSPAAARLTRSHRGRL
ncbi:O-antigen ligase family protein [Nocardioides aurantiacus]|uniref:O-antigen ligase family protein n=1 Tax=Nocardioides aurantiacus TaxID=86796 RepID=UPI00403F759A